MSSSTVTIEVPRGENETVFLLHVVQAALEAYRNTPGTSGRAHDARRLLPNGGTHRDKEETVLPPTSA
jgi:hypothetical protein